MEETTLDNADDWVAFAKQESSKFEKIIQYIKSISEEHPIEEAQPSTSSQNAAAQSIDNPIQFGKSVGQEDDTVPVSQVQELRSVSQENESVSGDRDNKAVQEMKPEKDKPLKEKMSESVEEKPANREDIKPVSQENEPLQGVELSQEDKSMKGNKYDIQVDKLTQGVKVVSQEDKPVQEMESSDQEDKSVKENNLVSQEGEIVQDIKSLCHDKTAQEAEPAKQEDEPIQEMGSFNQTENPMQEIEPFGQENNLVSETDFVSQEDKPGQDSQSFSQVDELVQETKSISQEDKLVQKIESFSQADDYVQQIQSTIQDIKMLQGMESPRQEDKSIQEEKAVSQGNMSMQTHSNVGHFESAQDSTNNPKLKITIYQGSSTRYSKEFMLSLRGNLDTSSKYLGSVAGRLIKVYYICRNNLTYTVPENPRVTFTNLPREPTIKLSLNTSEDNSRYISVEMSASTGKSRTFNESRTSENDTKSNYKRIWPEYSSKT